MPRRAAGVAAAEARQAVHPAQHAGVVANATGVALDGGDDRVRGGAGFPQSRSPVEPPVGPGEHAVLARCRGIDRAERHLHDAYAARSALPAVALRSAQPAIALRSDGPAVALRSDGPTIALRPDGAAVSLRSTRPAIALRSGRPTIALRPGGAAVALRSGGPTIALFADPEGHVVGLVKGS